MVLFVPIFPPLCPPIFSLQGDSTAEKSLKFSPVLPPKTSPVEGYFYAKKEHIVLQMVQQRVTAITVAGFNLCLKELLRHIEIQHPMIICIFLREKPWSSFLGEPNDVCVGIRGTNYSKRAAIMMIAARLSCTERLFCCCPCAG